MGDALSAVLALSLTGVPIAFVSSMGRKGRALGWRNAFTGSGHGCYGRGTSAAKYGMGHWNATAAGEGTVVFEFGRNARVVFVFSFLGRASLFPATKMSVSKSRSPRLSQGFLSCIHVNYGELRRNKEPSSWLYSCVPLPRLLLSTVFHLNSSRRSNEENRSLASFSTQPSVSKIPYPPR